MSTQCRTCLCFLTDTGQQSSCNYHILETTNLEQKLMRCLSIVIEPMDPYPLWICQMCYDKILDFWEFQEICYESMKQLESLITIQKQKEEEDGINLESSENVIKENRQELMESTDIVKAESKKVRKVRSYKENEHKENLSLDDQNKQRSDIKEDGQQSNMDMEETNIDNSKNKNSLINEEKNPTKCTAEKELHKCDLIPCERVYKSKSALNIHKRTFHKCGPELRTHMCEQCGKVFKSSAVLSEHRFTHVERSELPYSCEEPGCPKRFSSKEKLKVHKMRHAGIKNYVCPHCGMRKTTRNELKIHINYHTLERTWPCRFCDKVCNSSGNLKMHVRNIHERAKDYACSFCDRTFAKPDTRKYHEMTHTGEKPHACEICGRRFLQPVALRTHRKVHLRDDKKKKGLNVEESDSVEENTKK